MKNPFRTPVIPPATRILNSILNNPGKSATYYSVDTDIDRTNTSRYLKRLEERGDIELHTRHGLVLCIPKGGTLPPIRLNKLQHEVLSYIIAHPGESYLRIRSALGYDIRQMERVTDFLVRKDLIVGTKQLDEFPKRKTRRYYPTSTIQGGTP